MRVRFLNNWRVIRRNGLSPLWAFGIFNVYGSRWDSGRTPGFAPITGLSYTFGILLLNIGVEFEWSTVTDPPKETELLGDA